jgi:uracil-DNA glycosylase family 4
VTEADELRKRLGKLYLRMRDCRKCGSEVACMKQNQENASRGYGKLEGYSKGYRKGGIMFVAQNPSCLRIRGVATPCDGGVCEIFLLLLKGKGFKDEEVFLTNLVKCSTPKNRPPSAAERRLCAGDWLEEELAIVEPRLVVAIGGAASEHFRVKNGELAKWGNHRVFGMRHPSYVFRSGKYVDLSKQLNRLVELKEKPED